MGCPDCAKLQARLEKVEAGRQKLRQAMNLVKDRVEEIPALRKDLDEEKAKAEAERRRAEEEHNRAQMEQARADAEKKRADDEKKHVAFEKKRADEAKTYAASEKKRADEEFSRAEREFRRAEGEKRRADALMRQVEVEKGKAAEQTAMARQTKQELEKALHESSFEQTKWKNQAGGAVVGVREVMASVRAVTATIEAFIPKKGLTQQACLEARAEDGEMDLDAALRLLTSAVKDLWNTVVRLKKELQALKSRGAESQQCMKSTMDSLRKMRHSLRRQFKGLEGWGLIGPNRLSGANGTPSGRPFERGKEAKEENLLLLQLPVGMAEQIDMYEGGAADDQIMERGVAQVEGFLSVKAEGKKGSKRDEDGKRHRKSKRAKSHSEMEVRAIKDDFSKPVDLHQKGGLSAVTKGSLGLEVILWGESDEGEGAGGEAHVDQCMVEKGDDMEKVTGTIGEGEAVARESKAEEASAAMESAVGGVVHMHSMEHGKDEVACDGMEGEEGDELLSDGMDEVSVLLQWKPPRPLSPTLPDSRRFVSVLPEAEKDGKLPAGERGEDMQEGLSAGGEPKERKRKRGRPPKARTEGREDKKKKINGKEKKLRKKAVDVSEEALQRPDQIDEEGKEHVGSVVLSFPNSCIEMQEEGAQLTSLRESMGKKRAREDDLDAPSTVGREIPVPGRQQISTEDRFERSEGLQKKLKDLEADDASEAIQLNAPEIPFRETEALESEKNAAKAAEDSRVCRLDQAVDRNSKELHNLILYVCDVWGKTLQIQRLKCVLSWGRVPILRSREGLGEKERLSYRGVTDQRERMNKDDGKLSHAESDEERTVDSSEIVAREGDDVADEAVGRLTVQERILPDQVGDCYEIQHSTNRNVAQSLAGNASPGAARSLKAEVGGISDNTEGNIVEKRVVSMGQRWRRLDTKEGMGLAHHLAVLCEESGKVEEVKETLVWMFRSRELSIRWLCSVPKCLLHIWQRGLRQVDITSDLLARTIQAILEDITCADCDSLHHKEEEVVANASVPSLYLQETDAVSTMEPTEDGLPPWDSFKPLLSDILATLQRLFSEVSSADMCLALSWEYLPSSNRNDSEAGKEASQPMRAEAFSPATSLTIARAHELPSGGTLSTIVRSAVELEAKFVVSSVGRKEEEGCQHLMKQLAADCKLPEPLKGTEGETRKLEDQTVQVGLMVPNAILSEDILRAKDAVCSITVPQNITAKEHDVPTEQAGTASVALPLKSEGEEEHLKSVEVKDMHGDNRKEHSTFDVCSEPLLVKALQVQVGAGAHVASPHAVRTGDQDEDLYEVAQGPKTHRDLEEVSKTAILEGLLGRISSDSERDLQADLAMHAAAETVQEENEWREVNGGKSNDDYLEGLEGKECDARSGAFLVWDEELCRKEMPRGKVKEIIEATQAMELLATHLGWEWCYNELILERLWPPLAKGAPSPNLAGNVRLMGRLSRLGFLPDGTELPGVAHIRAALRHILEIGGEEQPQPFSSTARAAATAALKAMAAMAGCSLGSSQVMGYPSILRQCSS